MVMVKEFERFTRPAEYVPLRAGILKRFREPAERDGELGHIAGGGGVMWALAVGEAAGRHESRARHAQFGGAAVHASHERGDAARAIDSEGHGHVVGGLQQQRVEHLVDREAFARG